MNNVIVSLSEIELKYKNEWILIEDPVLDDQRRVVGGKVRFHSRNRDDVYRKATELRLGHSAFVYTGPAPENVLINL